MMQIQSKPDDPTKLGLIVVPTHRVGRVARRKLEEVLQLDTRLWKLTRRREQPIPTYYFPNGWQIEVHSAENPDSLRGPTASWVWMDEAAMCPEAAFDLVMPTLLSTNGELLGTTTPRGKENWTYRKIYLKSVPPGEPDHRPDLYDPNYFVVVGSTWENKANLSEKAIQILSEQYGGEDTGFGRQEIGGEFVTFEGLVYKWNADRDYLAVDQIPPISECSYVWGVLDFGWSPDPTAVCVMGYKDGTIYVYDEVYETELYTDSLAAELLALGERYGVPIWWADSANPDDIAELRRRGIPVRPVVKPRITVRVREMAAFADNGRLKVSYRCPNVRNEFQTYQWPENVSERVTGTEKKPVDKNNHAMDAIGYGIWMNRWLWGVRGDKDQPIESLTEEQQEARFEEFFNKLKGKSEPKIGKSGLYSR